MIFSNLKIITVECRVEISWLTTAGVLKERHQLAKIRGERELSERLMNFILVGITYIERQCSLFGDVYSNWKPQFYFLLQM